MNSYSVTHRNISGRPLKQALRNLKKLRRLTEMSMTKKEIDVHLVEIQSLANKIERPRTKRTVNVTHRS